MSPVCMPYRVGAQGASECQMILTGDLPRICGSPRSEEDARLPRWLVIIRRQFSWRRLRGLRRAARTPVRRDLRRVFDEGGQAGADEIPCPRDGFLVAVVHVDGLVRRPRFDHAGRAGSSRRPVADDFHQVLPPRFPTPPPPPPRPPPQYPPTARP